MMMHFYGKGAVTGIYYGTWNMEHRKTGRAMQLNENTLIETMLDVMPFAVYVVDIENMNIIHMNRVMVNLRGGNYTGKICHKAIYESDSRCFFCRIDDILDEKGRPNGETITYDHFDEIDDCWYQIQEKAITWPDGKVVKCSIAVDISELKEMQNHLAEAHAQLALKNRELEEATRHKSEFLANISHEIRTPLSAVIGLSDLAMKTELTTRQRDYLKKIHTSSKSLLHILNDILDFSKIEAGKIDLEHLPFELPQMLDDVSGMFYHAASQKCIELLLSLDDKVPWFVVGDPFRLGQIISNLLSNAIKFTDAGEITINVNLINQTDDHAVIRFAISDTGIGISESARVNLFRSFTQADASTSRKYGGSGLGLTICKKMVELMNGTIWMESTLGKGTTFTFEVLLELQSREKNRNKVMPSHLQGLEIIVADDNPVSLGVMQKMLENFGCQVVPVNSGERALELLRSSKRSIRRRTSSGPMDGTKYDLLITDWHMKEINGIELAGILKKDEILKNLPIILISAFDKDGLLMGKADKAGINAFISKPVNHTILLETITDILGKKEITPNDHPGETCADYTWGQNFKGKRVLLVDDNHINLQMGRELLEYEGAVVTTASKGKDAVDIIAESSLNAIFFDAVLMDVNMPEMDGYETTALIRRYAESTPIIAMTANFGVDERKRAMESGMNDFISKPVDPQVLYHILTKWVCDQNDGVINDPSRIWGHRDGSHDHHRDASRDHYGVTVEENDPARGDEGSYTHAPLGSKNTPLGSKNTPLDSTDDPLSSTDDPLLSYFRVHGPDQVPKDAPWHIPGVNPSMEEILDSSSGIKRVAGNIPLYRELMEQYMEDVLPRVAEVKSAIDNGSLEHASRVVHYIKGVSGNIGLNRAFGAADRLEKMLVSHTKGRQVLCIPEENPGPGELFILFEQETSIALDSVMEWLENNIPGNDEPDPGISRKKKEKSSGGLDDSGSHEGEEYAMQRDMRKLFYLLKENNTEAMEFIETVMRYPQIAELEEARQMAKKIFSLDFEIALDLLLRAGSKLSVSLGI
ncbi:MAG: response regulator [Desulfamplus sp.]|nr:response regulator [Desulfamplus sp.]